MYKIIIRQARGGGLSSDHLYVDANNYFSGKKNIKFYNETTNKRTLVYELRLSNRFLTSIVEIPYNAKVRVENDVIYPKIDEEL